MTVKTLNGWESLDFAHKQEARFNFMGYVIRNNEKRERKCDERFDMNKVKMILLNLELYIHVVRKVNVLLDHGIGIIRLRSVLLDFSIYLDGFMFAFTKDLYDKITNVKSLSSVGSEISNLHTRFLFESLLYSLESLSNEIKDMKELNKLY